MGGQSLASRSRGMRAFLVILTISSLLVKAQDPGSRLLDRLLDNVGTGSPKSFPTIPKPQITWPSIGPLTYEKALTLFPNKGKTFDAFPNFEFNVVAFLRGVGAVGNVG